MLTLTTTIKIRVKIPKLLMKTIQIRKNNNQEGGVCTENQIKTTKKNKKKKKRGLSSIFSSIFGAKKQSKDDMGHQDQKLPSMFKKHSLKEYLEAAKDDDGSGSSGGLPRAPSRVLTTRDKSKMALRKMGSKRLGGVGGGGAAEMVEENGGRRESGDKELCKKRILMGEKCKPLNYSGTLQYDKEGMLLPDTFSW